MFARDGSNQDSAFVAGVIIVLVVIIVNLIMYFLERWSERVKNGGSLFSKTKTVKGEAAQMVRVAEARREFERRSRSAAMSKKLFIYGISLTVLGEVLYIVKEICRRAEQFRAVRRGLFDGARRGAERHRHRRAHRGHRQKQ